MPRIVAVSVATPQPRVINGQAMQSSIVRDPSPTPIYFDMSGPRGNATAIHVEQVCVFCAERYDHWSAELGIDRASWKDCSFGENLMIEGLTEEDVRVGDRLQTSAGVLLEVTGPRSNCAKLSWRMGAPPSFLKRLVAVGWIGYYLRVLKPGWVVAGDSIELIEARTENATIAQLTRAIHEQQAPDLEFLRRAARATGLGVQTQMVLRQRIVDVEDVSRARLNRWSGWRRFKVVDKRREAQDITSIWLEPEDGMPIAAHRAGQFLTVRVPTGGGGICRSWSLAEYEDRVQRYRLTVKRIADGQGSSWIDTCSVGEMVEARAPAGSFVLDRSTLRRVILISAGIGITPLFAMLKAHAARGVDATPLIWLHSTASSQTRVFAEETDALLASNPRFRRQLHFTQPLPTDRLGVDCEQVGRITAATIAELVRDPYGHKLVDRAVQISGANNEVYICGPPAFEAEIRAAFIRANTVPHYIRSETFLPAEASGDAASLMPAQVAFGDDGCVLTWDPAENLSLLDLALAAGLEPDYSCRAGQCGSCVAELVEGEARYDPLPRAPVPEGCILLCCARPASARVIVQPARSMNVSNLPGG